MELAEFFRENNKIAIGFSGGVDSAYLLYAARQSHADVTAYYVKTAFQPEFERQDAKEFAARWKIPLRVISCDILEDDRIKKNPKNRCYYCKMRIFSAIAEAARKDGYRIIADGTNASDDASDRPGMLALSELAVRSPLRECRLTKDNIRKNLRAAGIELWKKPAYACLATRIASGEQITEDKLARTEQAEAYMASLGFLDFRIRCKEDTAKIQIREEQKALFDEYSSNIFTELGKLYQQVMLDSEYRK